jgi:hypothetical protein
MAGLCTGETGQVSVPHVAYDITISINCLAKGERNPLISADMYCAVPRTNLTAQIAFLLIVFKQEYGQFI